MFEKIRRPGRSIKDGKAKKWFSYFVFGLICLVFLFIVPVGTQFMGKGVYGYVGSEPIRPRTVGMIEESFRRQYRNQLEKADGESYSQIQQSIRQRALQFVEQNLLIVQGSQKAGFFLSDEELRSEIRSIPWLRQDGRFLYSRYLKFLKNQNLNPTAFEDQVRKDIIAKNWLTLFRKAVPSNALEQSKKSQRQKYKINFRHALLNAGDVEEASLENFVRSKDLKKVQAFFKKNKVEWSETGNFSLFSSFGIPITQNENVMEAVIHHLPSRGLIPRLIRQGDKIHVVQILSFEKGGAVQPENLSLESLLGRNFDKSARLLDSWLKVQRTEIKVRWNKQAEES